jgi:UDP-2-acetamido-2-deoxy-ribo-hexuluronate aminotransferase
VGHVVACANGTDALLLPLYAHGIGPGDAVFVPSFTFAATAEVVALAKAEPIFVDVDADTYNIDVQSLEAAIAMVKAEGRLKPRAIIPVDLFGQAADYAAIDAIARRDGLLVIEDAAQSIGGKAAERMCGSFGHVAGTSFYPAKPLGCYGDGGAILTDNDEIADAVRTLRSHGRQGTGDVAVRNGITGRLDTLQAAVLLSKLTIFEDELERRDQVAKRYDAALTGKVGVQKRPSGYFSANAIYTITLPNRDALKAALDARGIGNAFFYRVALHQHPAFGEAPKRPLPVSEQLADTVISLPMHPDLTDEEVERVIAAVLDVVG